MPADMVVEPIVEVAPVLEDTGFGLEEDVDIRQMDATSSIVSRRFRVQIQDEADIDKIRMPEVSLDERAWQRNTDVLAEVFDGILPVVRGGCKHTSIAPWDFLVRVTGIEQALMDMHTRPAYVHKLMDRLTSAFLARLEQYEELNLLRINNETYLGGGYDYTSELPGPGFDPSRVRTADMWGRTMSQIFSAVSPAMHKEFALRYERRWLSRFGLTYYGCCEPLHDKVDILKRNVTNLRKISMSPWIDLETAIRNVGRDFVFSLKPNPAVLAWNEWNSARARKELKQVLDRLGGLHVEIVMKDISTVRYEPQRLWEWAAIAVEEAQRAAG
jgi:hypothetical protein